MHLDKPIEKIGKWEFPSGEPEQVTGTLKISQRGVCSVTLLGNKSMLAPDHGALPEGGYDISAFLHGKTVPVMHGVCDANKPVSLIRARVQPTALGGAVNTCEISASAVVVGHRLTSYEEKWIKTLRFEIEGISECVKGMQLSWERTPDERHHYFVYHVPDDLTIATQPDFRVELCFRPTISPPSKSRRRLLLDGKSQIQLHFNEAGSLADAFKIVAATQSFLRFSFCEPNVALTSVVGSNITTQKNCEIYWPHFARLESAELEEDRVSQPALLIDENPDAYQRWLLLQQQSYIQLDAYFAALGHQSDNLMHQIISCATGLESLCKSEVIASSRKRPNFHDKMLHWVNQFGHEANLVEKDIDRFKGMRNAIAHEGQVDTQASDLSLLRRFTCLFSVVLLHKLGISKGKRDEIMQRGEWLYRMKNPIILS